MGNLLEKKTVKTVLNYLQNFETNISPICLDTTARTAKDAAHNLLKSRDWLNCKKFSF